MAFRDLQSASSALSECVCVCADNTGSRCLTCLQDEKDFGLGRLEGSIWNHAPQLSPLILDQELDRQFVKLRELEASGLSWLLVQETSITTASCDTRKSIM